MKKTHGNYVHGGAASGELLYGVWTNMKTRCYNPKGTYYKDYGGRGIVLCDEWKTDYAAFRAWAIKNGYKHGLTVDRVDNDRGYSPSNCRFVTQAEQAKNRRNTRLVTFLGKTKCAKDWAEEYGINGWTLRNRLRGGMPVEQALLTPVRGHS